MDLMWHSKIYTDVTLVKSATQESTVFSIWTKKKTITSRNISRSRKKSVNKFKPIYSLNISIKPYINRCLLNLPNLVIKKLGSYGSLSNKDINMDCRNRVVKTAGKRHKSKLLRASMNATDKLGSKKLFIMSMTSWHWYPSMWNIVGFKIKYN